MSLYLLQLLTRILVIPDIYFPEMLGIFEGKRMLNDRAWFPPPNAIVYYRHIHACFKLKFQAFYLIKIEIIEMSWS